MVKIAVIGAGINGVTCAMKIKEKYKDFDVVIISEDFSPNTTGDGSGGLWYPFLCGNTPEHLITKWGGETYSYLHQLWLRGGRNVSLLPVYALYRRDPRETRPGWARVVYGYQELDRRRLEYLSRKYSVDYVKWGGETYSYLHQLWLRGGRNVSLLPVYALYRRDPRETRPGWARVVYGYQELDRRRLEYLSRKYSVDYVTGHTFTTFVVQPPKIISYLYERFIAAGGRVVSATVTSLHDHALAGFAVVVNCTGLGARSLVPDDGVFPVRGQIFRAIVPWLNEVVVDQDSCHYIIPNAETCVLGGTHQDRDFNREVDKNDTDYILNGCWTMIPGLKHAEIIDTWVGLRPGRDAVRLEAEEVDGRLFIHNYGHGGSGLTLFWGCGNDVLSILEEHMKKKTETTKSKL